MKSRAEITQQQGSDIPSSGVEAEAEAIGGKIGVFLHAPNHLSILISCEREIKTQEGGSLLRVES